MRGQGVFRYVEMGFLDIQLVEDYLPIELTSLDVILGVH